MFKGLDKYIFDNLQTLVTKKGLKNYQTFGKDVEDLISDLVKEYLNNKQIKYKATLAKNKNDFPDLKLFINNLNYAFEYKAGRSDKVANDLGTLDSYQKKITEFGDRIYCIFIKYSIDKNNIIIDNVYFDKIYRFMGNFPSSNRTDILNYRKKDGNLRPKSWDCFDNDTIYTNTFEEFKTNIQKTIEYRSLKLVEQHLENIKKEDKEDIYKKLGKELGKTKKKNK